MQIRAMTDDDVDAVLALNEESVAALVPMLRDDLAHYRQLTPHTLVCVVDDDVAAFAIAYAPGTAYDSVNYLWHTDRFDDFLYLDRIAVSGSYRRRGIASALYDAMEGIAREHGRMVCEIYSDPPNEVSIAFHTTRGYLDVGHLRLANGHEVVMMEKPLEAIS
ncbi:MAG TPA: GNAT family N-acetyltransferase [Nocardioidaceae bacterium]|nr:GNAT family N-acetyltransferase [Nocardioidaceae bacterium]